MFRALWAALFASNKPLRKPHRHFRPVCERFDELIMPAQYLWTNGGGTGLWSTAANWSLIGGSGSAVPGSGDYAIFGGLGSDAACTVNGDFSADRVVMDSGYSGVFTVGANNKLTLNNQFAQYSGLVMAVGSEIEADSFYINGSVSMTGMAGSADLTANGSFFLNGTITVSGMSPGGPVLDIDTGGFDHGGDIIVGSSGGTLGTLNITGPFVQAPAADTTIWGGGVVSFLSGGVNRPLVEGTINLVGALNTADILALDGGDIVTAGAAASISGDVGVYNSGVITIGSSMAASTLTMVDGDLTVGALGADDDSPTGGVVNINKNSVLSFPDTQDATTFVVKTLGVINMYGANIVMDTGRVDKLEVRNEDEELDPGTMNTFGATGILPIPDTITGNVENYGIVQYQGGLHVLFVSAATGGGVYTQGEGGTLRMRLDEGELEDTLMVGDEANLDGYLELSGLSSLSASQTWAIIGAANVINGDFDDVSYPDAAGTWANPGGNPYVIHEIMC